MNENSDKRQLPCSTIRLICSLGLTHRASIRRIARKAEVATNTVRKVLSRAADLGVKDPAVINAMNDHVLLEKFYPDLKPSLNAKPNTINRKSRFNPDFKEIGKVMLEKHQELKDIFDEYVSTAVSYGALPFSKVYFYKRLQQEIDELITADDFYFAQDFKYGEEVEIDFSGDPFKVITHNGVMTCNCCVVVWPASYYMYAEFVTSQSTAESCRVFGNAIRHWKNRAPLFCVCDNTKAWVTSHVGKDVVLNPAFEKYMASLGICIDAAPPYHPQAKSAVEYSVNLTEKLCRKYRTDFTQVKALVEHSQHLMELVEKEINEGPFRKSIDKTRSYLFHNYELPAARVITTIPEFEGNAIIKTVPRSYLLTIEGHTYSVDYRYIKKQVEVYLTNDYVIIKHEGVEIARHLRKDHDGGSTILMEHRPEAHQKILSDKEYIPDEKALFEKCKNLGDENLYRFCVSRIELGKARNGSAFNALRSCKGVISFYEKCAHKNLVSECCAKVLQLDPKTWNTPFIKSMYVQRTNELPPMPVNREIGIQLSLFGDANGDKSYTHQYVKD